MLLHAYAGWHFWQHFFLHPQFSPMSVLTREPNSASQTSPELRILPPSQFFCSLWSCNYIFLNAVLSTVVVQGSFKAGNCACAAAPASVN